VPGISNILCIIAKLRTSVTSRLQLLNSQGSGTDWPLSILMPVVLRLARTFVHSKVINESLPLWNDLERTPHWRKVSIIDSLINRCGMRVNADFNADANKHDRWYVCRYDRAVKIPCNLICSSFYECSTQFTLCRDLCMSVNVIQSCTACHTGTIQIVQVPASLLMNVGRGDRDWARSGSIDLERGILIYIYFSAN
jgi:hypothetical protein